MIFTLKITPSSDFVKPNKPTTPADQQPTNLASNENFKLSIESAVPTDVFSIRELVNLEGWTNFNVSNVTGVEFDTGLYYADTELDRIEGISYLLTSPLSAKGFWVYWQDGQYNLAIDRFTSVLDWHDMLLCAHILGKAVGAKVADSLGGIEYNLEDFDELRVAVSPESQIWSEAQGHINLIEQRGLQNYFIPLFGRNRLTFVSKSDLEVITQDPEGVNKFSKFYEGVQKFWAPLAQPRQFVSSVDEPYYIYPVVVGLPTVLFNPNTLSAALEALNQLSPFRIAENAHHIVDFIVATPEENDEVSIQHYFFDYKRAVNNIPADRIKIVDRFQTLAYLSFADFERILSTLGPADVVQPEGIRDYIMSVDPEVLQLIADSGQVETFRTEFYQELFPAHVRELQQKAAELQQQ